MSGTLLLIQALNGLQLGVLLFLIAAGLTLVFGAMDVVNLAHGVQYMLGAYLAVTFAHVTGSFFLALLLAAAAALAFGFVQERLVFRFLLGRDHLEQVLATTAGLAVAEAGFAGVAAFGVNPGKVDHVGNPRRVGRSCGAG